MLNAAINSNVSVLALTGFVCCFLLFLALIFDIVNKVDVFLSAKWFFLVGFFVFMVVGILKNVFVYDSPVTENFETLMMACFIAIVSLASFLLSYGKPNVRRSAIVAKRSNGIVSNSSFYRLFLFSIIFFIAGIFGYSLYDPFGNPDTILDATNFDRFFVLYHVIAGILFVYLAIEIYFSSISRRNIRLVILSLFILVCFFSVLTRSSRYVSLYLVLFGPIYLYYFVVYIKGGGLSVFGFFAIILGAAVVFVGGNAIKTLNLMIQDADGMDIFGGMFFNLTVDRVSSLEFVDAFDNLCHIIEAYYFRQNFIYGESLSAPFVNFIPREWWLGKPSAFGVSMAEEVYGSAAAFNLAPSLAGELLANFGLIGVAAGFAIFGRVAKYIDKAISVLDNRRESMIYIIPVLYLLSMENRGDFTLNNELLYVVLPLYAVVWLSRIRSSVSRNCGESVSR